MTLFKIFKENEEQFALVRWIPKDIKQHEKHIQLRIIDGVTSDLEPKTVTDLFLISNPSPTDTDMDYKIMFKNGYNQALSDLKDKLLAERKLIEENK